MKSRIVTALFDIKRDTKGDGRTLDDYLIWFAKTLQLKCDMTIFIESKFENFVKEIRSQINNNTDIIIQSLDEIPFYNWVNKIEKIINSDYYKSNMKDINRIECYLPEYNLIQYSKFGWLRHAKEKHVDVEYFFWMDAGYSRFFDSFDMKNEWPNSEKSFGENLTILGNYNYVLNFQNMEPSKYMWDNNTMLNGGLFSIHKSLIDFVNNEIEKIFSEMTELKCVNNEQFAIAILAKRYNNLVNVIPFSFNGHNQLFLNFL
jgi:hypothetical protein